MRLSGKSNKNGVLCGKKFENHRPILIKQLWDSIFRYSFQIF
jgi:hypothetical protein